MTMPRGLLHIHLDRYDWPVMGRDTEENWHLRHGVKHPYRSPEEIEREYIESIGKSRMEDTECQVCFRKYTADSLRPLHCPKCGSEAWHDVGRTRWIIKGKHLSYGEVRGTPQIDILQLIDGWTWGFVWGHIYGGRPQFLFCRGDLFDRQQDALDSAEKSSPFFSFLPAGWKYEIMPLERGWRWFLHNGLEAIAIGPPCARKSTAIDELKTFQEVLSVQCGGKPLLIQTAPYCFHYNTESEESK